MKYFLKYFASDESRFYIFNFFSTSMQHLLLNVFAIISYLHYSGMRINTERSVAGALEMVARDLRQALDAIHTLSRERTAARLSSARLILVLAHRACSDRGSVAAPAQHVAGVYCGATDYVRAVTLVAAAAALRRASGDRGASNFARIRMHFQSSKKRSEQHR